MPNVGRKLMSPRDLVPGPGRLHDHRFYRRELPFMTNLERGEEIVSAAPQLFVDLDVEADGKPGYGSLLSIGGVASRYVKSEDLSGRWSGYLLQQEKFYRELRPTSDVWVSQQRDFCEAHGLQRARLLDEGIEPSQAMTELVEWEKEMRQKFEKASSVLVAFNASFDYPWIDLEMLRAGRENPFGIAGYCIKSLSQILAPDYDWSKTSKSQLPDDIVPPGDFTHNALEDAIYQQGMHFAMVGKINQLLGDGPGLWVDRLED